MNYNKIIRDALMDEQKRRKKIHEKLDSEQYELLQKTDMNYYLLKKFNFVIFSNNKDISDPNIPKKLNRKLNRYLNLYDIHSLIMNMDEELFEAIDIADRMKLFYRTCQHKNAKEELEIIINDCKHAKLKSIQEFGNTLINWKNEIINSFLIIPGTTKKMTSAQIENRNKTIKLIKASSNGYIGLDLNQESFFALMMMK